MSVTIPSQHIFRCVNLIQNLLHNSIYVFTQFKAIKMYCREIKANVISGYRQIGGSRKSSLLYCFVVSKCTVHTIDNTCDCRNNKYII